MDWITSVDAWWNRGACERRQSRAQEKLESARKCLNEFRVQEIRTFQVYKGEPESAQGRIRDTYEDAVYRVESEMKKLVYDMQNSLLDMGDAVSGISDDIQYWQDVYDQASADEQEEADRASDRMEDGYEGSEEAAE